MLKRDGIKLSIQERQHRNLYAIFVYIIKLKWMSWIEM